MADKPPAARGITYEHSDPFFDHRRGSAPEGPGVTHCRTGPGMTRKGRV